MDGVIRSFSGVLLRRALEKHGAAVDAASLAVIRQHLMSLWAAETDSVICRHLSHILAQSAASKSWIDLIPFVLSTASQGATESKVVSSLGLIEILSDYCPEDILTHLEKLGNFLGAFLSSADPRVQVACAKATGACIVALDDENARNSFKPALTPIINVVGASLQRNNEADATSIMEHLVSIAQVQPMFFRGALDVMAGAMLSVAAYDGLEFSTRVMALELLITISETAPALARRCQPLVQGVFPLAFQVMLEVEEEEDEWAAGKYSEEPCDDNSSAGEEAVERLAAGLGGRVAVEPVLRLVQTYSSSSSWRSRRAALAGLTRLAEGCAQHFKDCLEQAVGFLAAALQDSCARVRYEAIQCVGRFAVLFPASVPVLVASFIPQLTSMLGDARTCDRVRGHAASAMINLVDAENCDSDVLGAHLQPLLQALVQCLQGASAEVQPACLSLLGVVAQAAEEKFVPYYCSFMPGVKAILASATAPELATLRGKAMECAGLVAGAVGVEVFSGDALDVMTLLAGALGADVGSDATFEYILPACARISKSLGAHFEQFLPLVMPPLLAGATQEIQFSMEDAAEDDVEGEVVQDEEARTESTVVCLGCGQKKRVTLNTHAVQQKNQAARMLFEFAQNMGGHLRGHVLPCVDAAVALITDKHSADVRSSASLAVVKLIEAHIGAVKMGALPAQGLQATFSAVLAKLLESLKGEINATARACAAEALRDVLQAAYASGAENSSPEGPARGAFLVKPLLSACQHMAHEVLLRCADSIERRRAKESDFQDNEGLESEDREALREELEEEEELLANLADAMGQLLKLHGADFMPIFDSLIAPTFSAYLSPKHSEALQAVAVCILDDAIEFGGAAAIKYVPQAMQIFTANLASAHPVLRQASLYGIAQVARVAPQVFSAHISSVVPMLAAVLADPAIEDEANEGIRENALFAIGIACTNVAYRSVPWGAIDVSSAAALWLQGLPLRADEAEAKVAHQQLCTALETGDAAIIGQNRTNLPQLLRIISEIMIAAAAGTGAGTDAFAIAHSDTLLRMQGVLRQMKSTLPSEELSQAMRQLDFEKQRALLV